jgi:hypothetical protein
MRWHSVLVKTLESTACSHYFFLHFLVIRNRNDATSSSKNMVMKSSERQPLSAMKSPSKMSKHRLTLDFSPYSSLPRSGRNPLSMANASWGEAPLSSQEGLVVDPRHHAASRLSSGYSRIATTHQHAGGLQASYKAKSTACLRQSNNHNFLLENDSEIQSLLSMLKSNDFAGTIDPTHHSRFLDSPDACPFSCGTRIRESVMGAKRHHRSDGHLLHPKRIQT